ncbi:MAG: D-arabinono-1,4-lactone oxidase, partial [Actinomycetota bacterium]
PNLPSIPHFSIAGACATGTHGSGDSNQELAAAVTALELVTATGDPLTIERGDPDFGAAVVSLGALGVVSRLTLAIEPAYQVAQEIHVETPLDRAIAEVDEIMAEAYSVSWFLDWQHDTVKQIWRKYRLPSGATTIDTDPDLRGGRRATTQLALVRSADGAVLTPQLGQPGSWHERLPHVRPDRSAAPGSELQSEYFVARADGRAALEAVAAIGGELAPVMRLSEIRSVAAGDQWLSPFPTDQLALHFSWENDWAALRPVLARLEAALAPFAPRPHWGKLYELEPAAVRRRYPRFDDFVTVAERLDPDGVFRNPHLERLLG